MNTRSHALNGVAAALALAGFVFAAGAFAVDPAALPKKHIDAESCTQMKWNQEMLARYPWAVDACQEVVTVNGEKFARFEGHVVKQNKDGTFETQFVDRKYTHHHSWGSMDLQPAPGQHVLLSGEPAHFDTLAKDQVLSFYVPESRFAFVEEPGAPKEQFVTVMSAPPPSQPVAMAEPAKMPKTAGPLPLLALGGLVSLFGALGLSARRLSVKKG